MYYDFAGREVEDIEMDAIRRDAREDARAIEHQYWKHLSSGEIYAVMVKDERAYLAAGPLAHEEVTDKNLAEWNFEYEADLEVWLNANPDDFGLHEMKDAREIENIRAIEDESIVQAIRESGFTCTLNSVNMYHWYWTDIPLTQGVTMPLRHEKRITLQGALITWVQ